MLRVTPPAPPPTAVPIHHPADLRRVRLDAGLFCGSSSALNCVGAVRAARQLPPGSVIVTLLCDGGQRHLTRFWNRTYLAEHGIGGGEPGRCEGGDPLAFIK